MAETQVVAETQILVILYLLAFVWVILLTPPVRRLAFMLGAIDRPGDPRKIHTHIIARLGGLAVFLAFFLAFSFLPLVKGQAGQAFREHIHQFIGLLISTSIVMLAGGYDDTKGLRGRYKFLLLGAAGTVLWTFGIRIERLFIPLPGFGSTELQWWTSLPLTVVWVTLCAAALNFIDGLDGLATGVTLIATITLLCLGWGSPDRAWEVMLSCSLIGAVIGFLIFNFHPAKIFLGDSGALFLGFVVGAISIKSSFKSTTLATFILPIMVLGLPILDTVLAVVRRWARHVSIFDGPDRLHLHHRLMDQWGLSQRSAVFFFYIVSILLGGGALLLSVLRGQLRWIPVAGFGLLVVLLVALLRCQEVAIATTRLISLLFRRKGPPRHWMERAALFSALEQADSIPQVWQHVTEIMNAFQMQYGGLKLDEQTFADFTTASWEWTGPPELETADKPGGARWSAIYELHDKGRELGVFYLERNVIGRMSIEGLGEVVNKLTERLTISLSRLAAEQTG